MKGDGCGDGTGRLAAAALAVGMLGGLACEEPGKAPAYALAIHGGAGTIRKAELSPEREAEIRAALTEALLRGRRVLQSGGSSLDAVEAAVRTLEDSPLFNAAKGAVFAHEGTNELDASIMDGSAHRAGAVAAVRHVKNPVSLARAVMERSPHVLLVGDGAEAFARTCGIELVEPSYFYTEERWRQLLKAKAEEEAEGGGSAKEHGTVGAVALDGAGRLAAATSTGGMTNKRFGRVGDSPIIGAGTYADDGTCAVSCTGHGEFFIRGAAAYDVSARMRYEGLPVDVAARGVIESIGAAGGTGGLIALDRRGGVAMPFNTEGMYRGYLDRDGRPVVLLYGGEAGGP